MPKAAQEKTRPALPHAGILSCVLILTWALLLLSGCVGKQQTQQHQEATSVAAPVTFSGQWWEFYKRGLSFAEKEMYREATADFLEAIAKQDKDQWQAPIDNGLAVDYFPHRELGVIHVTRREYDKAIVELEGSMASAPSAKASYFLNKARADKSSRDATDKKAPEVHFKGSTAPKITSSCRKIVTGVASDDSGLAALTVAGQPVPVSLAEKHKVFTTEVALTEGKNSILAVATDLAGNTTGKTLEIVCDRRGPLIEIEQLRANDNQVTISGMVSDDHELGSLTINGRLWPVTGKAAGYNFKLSLPEGRITVVATDRAGNVTGARVRRDESDLREIASPSLPKTKEESRRDTEPPAIRIEGLDSEVETSADMARLTGQISDSSLLVYVSVNGE
ncbi:MAG: hypothetical protein ACYC9M_16180, partial [Desulfobulbaceae bacterium]